MQVNKKIAKKIEISIVLFPRPIRSGVFTFCEKVHIDRKRGEQDAKKMQWCADSVVGRRGIHLCRRWDAFGVPSPQLCVFDRNWADLLWCEAGLPK